MAAANSSSSNGQLAGKLQQRAQQNGDNKPAAKPATTISDYLEQNKGLIAQALPKHMSIERLTRIALTTIRTTPKLLECTTGSLMGAVMQSAQLGLEPGLLGHCYIIPYGKEAQFIIGYKGMIDLARRSGHILSIAAHVVHENDFIELVYGLDDKLTHVPWHLRADKPQSQSGKIKGAYMVAKFKDGGHQIHYMPISDIEAHRKRSKASNNGPWVTDYEEMVKKTVVRSGWKWLPISVEVATAVTQDEAIHSDIPPADDNIVIDLGQNDYSTVEEPENPAAGEGEQEELDLSGG